jgi:hypothetical protein
MSKNSMLPNIWIRDTNGLPIAQFQNEQSKEAAIWLGASSKAITT